LVLPDREVTPKLWEVKKVYQNIKIEADDLTAGTFKVTNGYFFTKLNEFDVVWSLAEHGRDLLSDELGPMDVAPGKSAVLTIPYPAVQVKAGAEYSLRISFRLRDDALWADAGHEVAWEQFALPFWSSPAGEISISEMPEVEVSENAGDVTVSGEGFRAVFSREEGKLKSLQYGNREMLLSGPVPNAYRSPTDNDKWVAEKWREAGLNDLQGEVTGFKVERTGEGVVKVEIDKMMRAGGEPRIAHQAVYTVYGNGIIEVDNRFQPEAGLPVLPKLGVVMALDKSLENYEWFGRGPQENYPDRKTGAAVGRYRTTVTELYEPYVRPQEMGNREDVRWAVLTDESGKGVLFVAEGMMSATALHFTAADLDAALHINELHPRAEVILCLDAAQCGLGNASCGPKPLDKYLLQPEPRGLSFSIRPYEPSMGDVAAVARLRLPKE
jgi:beta-galactosidase